MAYADLTTLRAVLGLAVGATGDDMLLSTYLFRATAIVDTTTRRTFEAYEDTTKRFDADADTHGRLLDWTPYALDLCAITTVTNGNGAAITSAQYVTEPRHATPYYGIRLKASTSIVWEWDNNSDSENAIAITGRWAYSITPPSDIVQVTLELATLLYQRRDTSSDINRPIIAGNATILPVGISRESIDILNSYRRLT